jgi:hypothetical protein
MQNVSRDAAYFKGRSIPQRLRTETCNSKSLVYAAEAEVSVYLSKDSDKRVVPRIYTVVIAHLRKVVFEDDNGIKVGGRTIKNLRQY